MRNTFYLALPRLHPSLAAFSLPETDLGLDFGGVVHTLWPGLANPSATAWTPSYPWNSAQAEACLRDFAATAALGETGAPVGNYSLESFSSFSSGSASQAGLSRAEQAALMEFRTGLSGRPAESGPQSAEDDASLAQRVLLLAWYQESQTEELRHLEEHVRRKRAELDLLLGDADPIRETEKAEASPSGAGTFLPLPDWEMVLTAAWQFFPQAEADGSELRVVVNDSAMCEALLARGSLANDVADIPPGWQAIRLGRGAALGLKKQDGDRETIFLFPTVS